MVTVFVNPSCQPCRLTKMKLKDRGIVYREVDLAEDEEAFNYVKNELGYSQAPVVVANDQHWSGFRPDLIDAI